uniref:Uncharacterized protein n=2 Tax=Plectus sambesii TaxID=2011161 RepID=A0A914WN54_9BILA
SSNLLDDEEDNNLSPPPRLSFPMPILPNFGHLDLDRGIPLLDDAPHYLAPPPPGVPQPEDLDFNNYEHISRGLHLLPGDDEGSSAESARAPNVLPNGEGTSQGRMSQAARRSSSRTSNIEASSIRRREDRPPLPPRQSDSIRASSLSSLGRRSTGQSDQVFSHYDVPRTSLSPIYDVLPSIAEMSGTNRTSSVTTTTTTSDSCSLSHNSRPTSNADLDAVFEGNVSDRPSPSTADDYSSLYENAHSPWPTSARGRSVTEDDYGERYQSLVSPPATIAHSLPTSPVRLSTVPPVPTSVDSPPPLPPRGFLERSPASLDQSSSQGMYSETRETLRRRQLSTTRQHEVDVVRQEMSRTVKVQISLSDCVDGLALVEIGQRLWVAGWTQPYDKRLSAAFHIGDHVIAVNNTTVTSASQIPAVYYATNTPGLPITFDMHRLPNGRVHFITKRPNEHLGIVFAKGKNKVNSVEAGSAAAEAGLEASMKCFFDSTKTCPAVLTEVNGRPLNLFAKNNDLNERLAAIGDEITAKMHRCAATCCDDQSSGMESVQRCMEQCQSKLMKAQQVLEGEMNDFQMRLMRCAQTCQDKVKTQVGPNTPESELPKYHAQLDSCILKCADDHVAQIPKLQSNLLATLKKL